MNLPEFLRSVDGEIRLTGHRIGLVHVVKLYNEGYSAEMIAAYFPTLPLSLVHRVIAFYLENQEEVDREVTAHEQEMERLEAEARRTRTTPTIEELRRRLASMGRAGQG
jgi:uncharacterized protein (DUF433 family)